MISRIRKNFELTEESDFIKSIKADQEYKKYDYDLKNIKEKTKNEKNFYFTQSSTYSNVNGKESFDVNYSYLPENGQKESFNKKWTSK